MGNTEYIKILERAKNGDLVLETDFLNSISDDSLHNSNIFVIGFIGEQSEETTVCANLLPIMLQHKGKLTRHDHQNTSILQENISEGIYCWPEMIPVAESKMLVWLFQANPANHNPVDESIFTKCLEDVCHLVVRIQLHIKNQWMKIMVLKIMEPKTNSAACNHLIELDEGSGFQESLGLWLEKLHPLVDEIFEACRLSSFKLDYSISEYQTLITQTVTKMNLLKDQPEKPKPLPRKCFQSTNYLRTNANGKGTNLQDVQGNSTIPDISATNLQDEFCNASGNIQYAIKHMLSNAGTITKFHKARLDSYYAKNQETYPTALHKFNEIFIGEINNLVGNGVEDSNFKVFVTELKNYYSDVHDKIMEQLKSKTKKIDAHIKQLKIWYEEEMEKYVEENQSKLCRSELEKYHYDQLEKFKVTLRDEILKISPSEPTSEHFTAFNAVLQKSYKDLKEASEAKFVADISDNRKSSSNEPTRFRHTDAQKEIKELPGESLQTIPMPPLDSTGTYPEKGAVGSGFVRAHSLRRGKTGPSQVETKSGNNQTQFVVSVETRGGIVRKDWKDPNRSSQPRSSDDSCKTTNNNSRAKEFPILTVVKSNGRDSEICNRKTADNRGESSTTSAGSQETPANSSQTKSSTINSTSRQSECFHNPEPTKLMQDMGSPSPSTSIVFYISSKYIGVALEDDTKKEPMFYPAVITLNTNDHWVLGEVDKQYIKHQWELSNLWDLETCKWRKQAVYWNGHLQKLCMEVLLSVALCLVRNEFVTRLRNSSETIIAVPFWFTSLQRQQILDAAKIAGFCITKIINENTSSAYYMYASQKIPTTDELVVISENCEIIDISIYKFGKSNDISMIASSEPIFIKDSPGAAKQSYPSTNDASKIDLCSRLEKVWKVINIDQLNDSSNGVPFLISGETDSLLKVIKTFADSVCMSKVFCTGKETALLGLLKVANTKEHSGEVAGELMLDDGTSYSLSITSKLDKSFARPILRRSSSCERNMSCKLLNKNNTYYVQQVKQDMSWIVGEIRMLGPLNKSCQYIATFSNLDNGILKLEKIEEENSADKHNKLVELASSKYIWKPMKLSDAKAQQFSQFLKQIEEKQSIQNQNSTTVQSSLFVQATEALGTTFRKATDWMKKGITKT